MPRLKEYRWQAWAEHVLDVFTQDQPSLVAIDTETTGVGFYDQPFAATLTWRRPSGDLFNGYIDLEADGREGRIAQLGDLLRAAPAWVGHNTKFDLQKLVLVGAIEPSDYRHREIHDTMTMYHLLDENSPKGLKDLAVSVLGVDDTIEVEVKSGKNKGAKKRVPREAHQLAAVRRKLGLRKEDGYHLLPREVLVPYALRDTEFTLRLFEALIPRLAGKRDEKLLALYAAEMRLVKVALKMEADGFKLDLPYLEEKTQEYGVRVMEGWGRVVALTSLDFNANSPDQVMAAFKARGIHLEDTQAATLRALDDDLARTLLTYREDFKLYKTYLRGLFQEERGGLVHPNFNLTGTVSGRMSSGSPKE